MRNHLFSQKSEAVIQGFWVLKCRPQLSWHMLKFARGSLSTVHYNPGSFGSWRIVRGFTHPTKLTGEKHVEGNLENHFQENPWNRLLGHTFYGFQSFKELHFNVTFVLLFNWLFYLFCVDREDLDDASDVVDIFKYGDPEDTIGEDNLLMSYTHSYMKRKGEDTASIR